MKQEQAYLLMEETGVYIIMEMGNVNVIDVTIECRIKLESHKFDIKHQFNFYKNNWQK